MGCKILGIMGRAGAGKDTLGRFLTSRHIVELGGQQTDIRQHLGSPGGGEVMRGVQLGMADPLKSFCHDVYDFSIEQLWGPSNERNRPDKRYPRDDGTCLTPREALQRLGTEWGRGCYNDTWIRLGLRRAQDLLARRTEPVPIVVFTDIRFVNEARAVKAQGGLVWRVDRPGAGLAGAAGQHQSEQELDDPEIAPLLDRVIENDGTIEELEQDARAIVKEWR